MTRTTVLALALGAGIAGITAATLVATDTGRPAGTAALLVPALRAAPVDLAPSLHRCAAIDHGDPDTGFCMAVWEENRRRFLGRPAQPLRSPSAPALQPEGVTP